MFILDVSYDTQDYEVSAEIDENGRLTSRCVRKICRILDESGFVVIPQLQSEQETATGLQIVLDSISDSNREKGDFASQTDIKYGRRDFCALPSTKPVLAYAAMLCQRLESVLGEYCGRTRNVLEISTMTSYLGSSHQYIHRDPEGVLCLFAAVDDVSPEQGGTVFVPGTHKYSGSDMNFDDRADFLVPLYQVLSNIRILRYNLANIWRMRKSSKSTVTPQEFRDRVFSRRFDDHQPNLARFILGRNSVFDLFSLGPRRLLKLFRYRKTLEETFRLVQTSPKKGTVILYRSDMLHAGPDNRSTKPRFFFGMSIARDIIFPERWRMGYAPHTTLLAEPKTLGDLLDSTE